MAKAKANAAPAKEKAAPAEIVVGSWVDFLGYPKGTKKEEMVLDKGASYEVVALPGTETVDGEEVETGFVLRIPNPDFDSKKKANDDTNPEFLETEVFPEEIELSADQGGADEGEEGEEGEEGSDAEAGADAGAGEEGGEEEPLTYEELASYSQEELIEFAKANEVKVTAAQKKSPKALLDLLAAEFDLKPAPKTKPAAKGAAKAKEAEAEAPAKGAAKGKAAAKAKEEEAPAKTPAKGKAADKAAAKAPAKAKAPADEGEEGEDPDAVPDLDGEDEEVLALVDGDNVDLVAVAQDLESQVASNEYRLGGVLYHIKKNKLHLKTDKKGKLLDPEYAETGGFKKFLMDHFNLDYRKATYLIDIYINFTLAGIENPAEVVGNIGWTKASKISKLVAEEDADVKGLLEAAETNSVADLSEIIKEQFTSGGEGGTPGTPGEKKTRLTLKFRYFEEEANSFEDALKELSEQFGVKPEEALLQIVLDAHAREVAGGGAEEEEEEAPATTKASAGKGRAKARA